MKRAFAAVAALIVLLGPEFAANSPTKPVGVPYSWPTWVLPFGTDHLGRDVLSRMLHGGRPLVLTSLAAALAGVLLGAVIGLAVALTKRQALMWPLDAIAAVPPILVLLLTLTAMPDRVGLVLAVAVVGAPLAARVTQAAAAQVVGRAHVEIAIARGENWAWLLGREILPLVGGTVLADAGMRFVTSVHLVAAAGFLGLSVSDSDWGLLIVEALPGASLQPWALLVPVLGVALLAVSSNLFADRVARHSRGMLG
ncbi:ABC transporter permease [Allokutzneria multivorans]|uniref:ABC transporter permease n=1 Tax=Allokutzneria multivorans TaxID=1142134 RepID=A0ABP7S049_9PSEU